MHLRTAYLQKTGTTQMLNKKKPFFTVGRNVLGQLLWKVVQISLKTEKKPYMDKLLFY